MPDPGRDSPTPNPESSYICSLLYILTYLHWLLLQGSAVAHVLDQGQL